MKYKRKLKFVSRAIMNQEPTQLYIRAQDHDDFEDGEIMDLEDLFDKLINEPEAKNVDGSS